MSSWDTEKEEGKPEYQAKAHLVLEGSNEHEWGVVKDCHGCVNHIPEDAEIVGTWNKYGEGVFWVSLETSPQALRDKATLLIAELAEERKKEAARWPARKRPLPAKTDTLSALDKLKAKIKGG